jgi:uncharacterized damage-inducible protein DinB
MNARDTFLRLAENNAWANHRLHDACARLDGAAYAAARVGFFPSIRGTLLHIFAVDRYYLDAIEGGGLGPRAFDEAPAFDELAPLREAQRALDRRLVAAVTSLEAPTDLDRRVRLVRADHEHDERLGDVLLHLFQHQIHHRGQAHAMLAGTDVRPPQLDEFFLADELPLREAELRALGLPLR